jgi:hypothetical protein
LDASEVGGIAERLQDAAPVALREVDVADRSVLEGEAQAVVSDDLDGIWAPEAASLFAG